MLFYQTFATFPRWFYLHTLCYFITFCCLIKLLASYQSFYVSYAPYKCTFCTHHKYNAHSCLIVRTLSAPIHLSNSPGVFGHRAILMWGYRGMARVFSKNNLLPSQFLAHHAAIEQKNDHSYLRVLKFMKPHILKIYSKF